jgi:Holliday junction resolvase RusA-like endonuclease
MLSFASEKEFKTWANAVQTKITKKIKNTKAIKNTKGIQPRISQNSSLKFSNNQAEFFFDYMHPSVNEYMRWHWSKRVEETQTCHWLVKSILGRQKIFIPNPEIHTTIFFTDRRRRDAGNYVPKFLIDALVKEGVIEDDCSRKLLETMPELRYREAQKGILIIIKERSS